MRAELLREAEPASLLQLGAKIVRSELVRFVEDGEVPAGGAELVLKFLVPGELVQTNNQPRIVIERVPAGRCLLQHGRVDVEFKAELLEQLVTPLFDEASWCDDQDAV